MNLYEFALNEPINWFDGDGRAPTEVPNSGGHGNCLSYALGDQDNKKDGYQPTNEDYTKFHGNLSDWLDAQLRNHGCKERTGNSCPAELPKQIDTRTGKDPNGGAGYHSVVMNCGSTVWSQRRGPNEAIQVDVPSIDKQSGLTGGTIKHWCCPCNK